MGVLLAEGAVEAFRAGLWLQGIVRRVDFTVRFRVHEALEQENSKHSSVAQCVV